MSLIENMEKLLAAGRDDAMVRFGLGNAYLKAGDPDHALEHLRRATEQDPDYSAAWKLLGRALEALQRWPAAQEAYRQGIAVAEAKGDLQAVREMGVFLKRVEKRL